MNRPVVLICRSGHRSIDAGLALEEAGFKEVYTFSRASKARWTRTTTAVRWAAGARRASLGAVVGDVSTPPLPAARDMLSG